MKKISILLVIAIAILSQGSCVTIFPTTTPQPSRTNTIGKGTRSTGSPFLIIDKNNNIGHGYSAQESDESDETSGKISSSQNDANKFVDAILEKLRAKIVSKGLNKITLPSQSKEFSRRIRGIRFHGEAKLFNGSLTGTDSIHRLRDAEIHSYSNGSMRLDFDVQLEELDILYMLKLRFMDRIAEEDIIADLLGVTAHMRLRVGSDGHVLLDQFDVTDMGQLRIHTRGLGPFNFVVNGFAAAIANSVKGVVLESLEGRIKSLLSSLINESLYPPRAITELNGMKETLFQKFVKMTKFTRGYFGPQSQD